MVVKQERKKEKERRRNGSECRGIKSKRKKNVGEQRRNGMKHKGMVMNLDDVEGNE